STMIVMIIAMTPSLKAVSRSGPMMPAVARSMTNSKGGQLTAADRLNKRACDRNRLTALRLVRPCGAGTAILLGRPAAAVRLVTFDGYYAGCGTAVTGKQRLSLLF